MKKTLYLLVALVFLASCNSNGPKGKSSDESTYTVASLMENAEEKVGMEVTVEGLVVHVCKHGGQKMFITGEDKEVKMKVNVSNTIAEFDVALEGSTVKLTGIVVAVEQTPHKEDGEGEHHAEEVEETKEGEDCASKEGEDCESKEGEDCASKETAEEETAEEDCDFEKETVVYEILALSFEEVK